MVLLRILHMLSVLKDFYEPVMFEKLPAASTAPDKVYLKEVESSQLYLMLLGTEYGYEDEKGLSPTEHEYRHAQSLNKTIHVCFN